MTAPNTAPVETANDIATLDDGAFLEALNIKTETPVERPRNEKGEFVTTTPTTTEPAAQPTTTPEAGSPASPETPPTGTPTPPTPETPPETKPPEGEVKEEPKPEEEKKLLTKFSVFDEKGQELEIPDLRLTYKADGKVKENVPLDKVVLLAQMGEYNARREADVAEFKRLAPQLQTENQQMQNYIAEVDTMLQQMFADPDYYQNAAEDFQKRNSPELRAERAEAELRKTQQQSFEQVQTQQAIGWINNNIVPAFEAVESGNPLVTKTELMGYYSMMMAPLLVQGRIPPQRLEQVKSLVDTDLAHWAKGLQLEREEKAKGSQAQVMAHKVELTRVKNSVARAVAPTALNQPPTPPKVKVPQTAEEWINATFPTP